MHTLRSRNHALPDQTRIARSLAIGINRQQYFRGRELKIPGRPGSLPDRVWRRGPDHSAIEPSLGGRAASGPRNAARQGRPIARRHTEDRSSFNAFSFGETCYGYLSDLAPLVASARGALSCGSLTKPPFVSATRRERRLSGPTPPIRRSPESALP